jgi:hypothetical protein
MYTGQQVRVFWNGIFTRVISPSGTVLNRAVLLAKFYFVFILMMRYADFSVRVWVVILVISLLRHWRMQTILSCFNRQLLRCDRCSLFVMISLANFTLLSNASKSICVTFPPRYLKGRPGHDPVFHVANNVIENTQQWLHLRHMLTSELSDHADIAKRRNYLIGRVKNLLCQFSMLDCMTVKPLCNS